MYLMNLTRNHVTYVALLALVGLVASISGYAQDSNMRYWEYEKQVQMMHLKNLKQDINYLFRSRVLNDSTSQAIRDCHVINKTQRTGTVSDANGDFKIMANANDSISFSALGYEKLTIALTDSMFNYGYMVKLKPAVYPLSEVTVRPFQLELPSVSRFAVYTPPLPNQGGIKIPVPEAIAHPVTALYDLLSKEGKQKRHYKKVVEGTADYILVGEKFNGEIVAKLTGLKNDELVQFMSFCNFSKEFLLYYSPETIKRAIRIKYKEYTLSDVQ
jgi:hypothetical protein